MPNHLLSSRVVILKRIAAFLLLSFLSVSAYAQGPARLGVPTTEPSSSIQLPPRTRSDAFPTITPRGTESSPPVISSPSQTIVTPPSSTTIVPPGTPVPGVAMPGVGCPCEFDYWIVSSRNCKGNTAPCNSACCLNYFHRTSERCLLPSNRDVFLSSLKPNVPVCFVIHGSYNWWSDVVKESLKINRWIRSACPGEPLQVVFFSWPSDGNMPFIFPVDIAVLGRKSSYHALYLADLITQFPPEQPVSLVGHSHGARTAVAAMHVLGGGRLEEGGMLPPGYSVPRRMQAVLIAAAIDHDWLNPGQRYGQSLLPVERVLLLRNSSDATLAIYPMRKPFGDRALGKNGLGVDDRLALDSLGYKVVELDARQFARWHHSWADYHSEPALASAVSPYIHLRDDGPTYDGLPAGPMTAPQPISPEPVTPAETSPMPARRERYTFPRVTPASQPIESSPAKPASKPLPRSKKPRAVDLDVQGGK